MNEQAWWRTSVSPMFLLLYPLLPLRCCCMDLNMKIFKNLDKQKRCTLTFNSNKAIKIGRKWVYFFFIFNKNEKWYKNKIKYKYHLRFRINNACEHVLLFFSFEKKPNRKCVAFNTHIIIIQQRSSFLFYF